jgi:CubicO group peptidase (beta-lactamase class C family)
VARIIEKVTGLTFERAVQTLILEPPDLRNTCYDLQEVMCHTAAFGHDAEESGRLIVAREWKDNRANNGGAGIASSVADLLRWARFHLVDPAIATTPAAAGVLPSPYRAAMQTTPAAAGVLPSPHRAAMQTPP